MLDLLDGQGRARGAPAGGVRLSWRSPRPRCRAALAWLTTRVRHLAEGLDEEPRAQPDRSPASASAGFATAVLRGHVHRPSSSRSRTTCSASPGSSSRHAGPARRPDRPRPRRSRRARAWSTQLLEGKVPATTLALVRYAVDRRPGPRHRRHAGLPGRADGAGPGLAHRPRACGGADRRRPADELTESLGALAGAPVELQVEVDESLLSGALDPHRRPPGGRHGAGPARRPA